MGRDDHDLLDLTWPQQRDPQEPCSYAADFEAFCTQLLAQLTEISEGDLEIAFAQAKVLLLDRYCDFLTDTPPHHANARGTKKHRCLVDVLNHTVRQIRLHQRSRIPPKLIKHKAPDPEGPPAPFGIG